MPKNKRSVATTEKKIYLFQVKPIKNSNNAQIKCVGFVGEDEKFTDERLDIGTNPMDDGGKALKVMDDVYVLMYKCRITDAYLLSNKKLPVMYATIMYQRPFATGYLFSVNIFFEITSDTSKIKSINDLIETTLEGKYTTEILLDDNKKEIINQEKFLGQEESIKYLSNLVSNDATKELITIYIEKRTNERRKRLGSPADFTPTEPKYNFNKLLEMYENGIDMKDILASVDKPK